MSPDPDPDVITTDCVAESGDGRQHLEIGRDDDGAWWCVYTTTARRTGALIREYRGPLLTEDAARDAAEDWRAEIQIAPIGWYDDDDR